MRNKFAPLAAAAFNYFTLASTAFALINLSPGRPQQGINPATDPRVIITNAITIIFVIAVLAVLVYMIWGAFSWITSGGDKEKIKAARGMITNALIGLEILALAFIIARVVGAVLGIDFANLTLPRLDAPANITPAVPSNQTQTPR